jgi:hypothetical protein
MPANQLHNSCMFFEQEMYRNFPTTLLWQHKYITNIWLLFSLRWAGSNIRVMWMLCISVFDITMFRIVMSCIVVADSDIISHSWRLIWTPSAIRTLIFPFSLAETEESEAGGNETSSYACCYNGCVTTCTKKLEPPIGKNLTPHPWPQSCAVFQNCVYFIVTRNHSITTEHFIQYTH